MHFKCSRFQYEIWDDIRIFKTYIIFGSVLTHKFMAYPLHVAYEVCTNTYASLSIRIHQKLPPKI